LLAIENIDVGELRVGRKWHEADPQLFQEVLYKVSVLGRLFVPTLKSSALSELDGVDPMLTIQLTALNPRAIRLYQLSDLCCCHY
jgi:hypothetical protein